MKTTHNFNEIDINILDVFRIKHIKAKLKCNRFIRRCIILFRINKVTLYLIPIWMIFMFIIYGIEYKLCPDTSFVDVLLDNVVDIFTSVIIVLFINTINGIKKHKMILHKQYDYYNKLYYLTDKFFFDIYHQLKKRKGPYCALDTSDRFYCFYNELHRGDTTRIKNISKHVDKIKSLLIEIKNDDYYDEFYNKKDFEIKKCKDDFRANIDILISKDADIEWIENLYYLYDLVNELGYIWRVDIPLRIEIDKMLHEKYLLVDYDDKFLYEIFCSDTIEKNPWQSIVDSFAYSTITYKGKKYNIRKKVD